MQKERTTYIKKFISFFIFLTFSIISEQLLMIKQFKEKTGHKVILNKFGLITTGYIADEDVSRYLSCIIEYTKKNDIPWTYWSYSGSFGVYNTGFLGFGSGWRQNVLDTLMS